MLACSVLCLLDPARGDEILWNAGSGIFGDPSRWSAGHVPGPTDTAVFDTGGSDTVSTTETDYRFTVDSLVVQRDDVPRNPP